MHEIQVSIENGSKFTMQFHWDMGEMWPKLNATVKPLMEKILNDFNIKQKISICIQCVRHSNWDFVMSTNEELAYCYSSTTSISFDGAGIISPNDIKAQQLSDVLLLSIKELLEAYVTIKMAIISMASDAQSEKDASGSDCESEPHPQPQQSEYNLNDILDLNERTQR